MRSVAPGSNAGGSTKQERHCEAQHLRLLATLESAEKQSPFAPVGTAVIPAAPAVPPIQALSLALLLPPMLSREG